MSKALLNYLLIACSALLAACGATKHLPPGEHLYTGAKIVQVNNQDLSARQKKVIHEDLEDMVRPKPNSRFLGIPFKLGIYNMFRKAKPNSFFGRLRSQFGEPPVLVSQVDIPNNVKLLQNHMENKGYFQARVSGDTVVKGKRGHASFRVEANRQYTINSVRFPADTFQLGHDIVADVDKSLLKPKEPYDLDLIKGERNRIDARLKEKGYFFFSPDYLLLQVDSTVGDHKVDMVLIVKKDAPAPSLLAYRINNTYIFANYRLSTANMGTDSASQPNRPDTSISTAVDYEGFKIVDRRKRFKPKMWPRIMVFKPGDIYNRTDHNTTLSRLINLNEFRYVKNRFEPVTDSAKLDAYYYLTPQPKKNIRAEFGLTTKSNNLNGTQINFTFRNRNTFGQAEQLLVSAYIGTETQFGGTFQGYNTYRTGAEATLSIPRFVVPFFHVNTTSAYVPRTNIQFGYDLLTRMKLYTVNSYRGQLGYSWKRDAQHTFEVNPVSINYTQPLNVTKEYRDSLAKYPYLQRVIDSQFVLGSNFQFNYNEVANGLIKINSFYLNGLLDLSGNIAGLITGATATTRPKRIAGAIFDQYIKMEVDGRYYRKIGLKSSWVNRLNIGYGIPYGNSVQMPYIKQFFVGGNNSLRGFRSRSVGPGTFRQVTASTFLADQTGDIKIEANTEYRPHISGPLYGAVFIDAGNIWLAREDTTRPGSGFGSGFLNQLAADVGIGIRLDVTIFVIRLDAGFPIRKPWEQNPWVLNQIKFGDQSWRRSNIIYNLAIGYPF
jgi:outer membrane protein insertion porin family